MKRMILLAGLLLTTPAMTQDTQDPGVRPVDAVTTFNRGYCDGYRKAMQELHGNWQRWDTLVNIMNTDPTTRDLVTVLRASVKHFVHKGDLPASQPFAFMSEGGVFICEGH